MKKIVSLVVCFLFLLGVMPSFPALAEDEIKNGTCGATATWTLNRTTGEFTISGSGAIPDYGAFKQPYDADHCAPWHLYGSDIRHVVIEEGITTIGAYAFLDCQWIEDFTLPESVTEIVTMDWTAKVQNFSVDPENPVFSSLDGNLYNKDKTVLIRYATGKTESHFTVPDTVTLIGANAFYGAGAIESVNIPSSVTEIQANAFTYTHLREIVLPEGMRIIGNAAFEGCDDLQTVTIPKSVVEIGSAAFWQVKDPIKNIYYNGNKADWEKINVGSKALPEKATLHTAEGESEMVYPSVKIYSEVSECYFVKDEPDTAVVDATIYASEGVTLDSILLDWYWVSPQDTSKAEHLLEQELPLDISGNVILHMKSKLKDCPKEVWTKDSGYHPMYFEATIQYQQNGLQKYINNFKYWTEIKEKIEE